MFSLFPYSCPMSEYYSERPGVEVDFDCPECGDAADERGCINGCDISDYDWNTLVDQWDGNEDAAMEMHLFGDC